jgi:hypothetical protein
VKFFLQENTKRDQKETAMKKVLVFMAVIALTASISSATTTLEVWTTLVSGTFTGVTGQNPTGWTYGTTPVELGPKMALGSYGVQVWAQVLGGASGAGISDMAVTLYTPDTSGAFTPVQKTFPPHNPPYGIVTFGSNVSAYNQITPVVQHWAGVVGTSNPGTDLDSVQMAIGDTNYVSPDLGIGSPVLIATEAWNLTSLATNGVTVGVYVAPTSRYWDMSNSSGDNTYKHSFDSVVGTGMVIPEPITMTMLAMGLSGLGIMIRRRTKEVV